MILLEHARQIQQTAAPNCGGPPVAAQKFHCRGAQAPADHRIRFLSGRFEIIQIGQVETHIIRQLCFQRADHFFIHCQRPAAPAIHPDPADFFLLEPADRLPDEAGQIAADRADHARGIVIGAPEQHQRDAPGRDLFDHRRAAQFADHRHPVDPVLFQTVQKSFLTAEADLQVVIAGGEHGTDPVEHAEIVFRYIPRAVLGQQQRNGKTFPHRKAASQYVRRVVIFLRRSQDPFPRLAGQLGPFFRVCGKGITYRRLADTRRVRNVDQFDHPRKPFIRVNRLTWRPVKSPEPHC